MRYGYYGYPTDDKLRPIMSLEWFFDQDGVDSAYGDALSQADHGNLGALLYLLALAVKQTTIKISEEKFGQVHALIREALDKSAAGPGAAAD